MSTEAIVRACNTLGCSLVSSSSVTGVPSPPGAIDIRAPSESTTNSNNQVLNLQIDSSTYDGGSNVTEVQWVARGEKLASCLQPYGGLSDKAWVPGVALAEVSAPWPNNGGIPTSAQYESLAHLSLGHWDERNRDHGDDLRWMKRGIVSSTFHQLCLVRDRKKLNEVCESEYFFSFLLFVLFFS